jgi:hypothetical protein
MSIREKTGEIRKRKRGRISVFFQSRKGGIVMSIEQRGNPRFRAVLVAVVSLLVLGAYAAPDQSDAARAAAAGLKPFLNCIPTGQEPAFGFANRAEFNLAYLGLPYEVVSIHPRYLAAGDGGIEKVLTSMGQFRFPILCNGKACSLLTVALVDGEWKAVEIGAAGLAAMFDRVEQSVPPPGKQPRRNLLLRLYQLNIDFAGYYQEGQNPEDGHFVPLPSALMAIGAGPEEIILYSFSQVLKIARDKFAALSESLRGDAKKGVIR